MRLTLDQCFWRPLRIALGSPCLLCNQSARGDPVCAACTTTLRQTSWGVTSLAIDDARIPVLFRESYGGLLSDAVIRSKYRGDWGHARWLGQTLGCLPRPWLGDPPVALPIPLSDQRLADRGYNQSVFIARQAARAWGLKMTPRWLRKTKRTARQAGLARDERFANLSGSFWASEKVAGQRCLLIDDIMTTGSTLREAARVIHARGGLVIAAAVIARVHRPSRSVRHSLS